MICELSDLWTLSPGSPASPSILGRLITAVPITQSLVSWLPVGVSHREARQWIQSMAREVKVYLSQPPSPSGVRALVVDRIPCHDQSN